MPPWVILVTVNCRETEELLGAYRDGQLAPPLRLEVEAHVRCCPACTATLRGLQAVSAIRLGLAGGVARRAGRWPLVVLAAAACVVAFMVLGTGSQSGNPETALAQEAVSAHIRSLQADHLLDIATRDVQTVQAWFAGRLVSAPGVAPPAAFELLGGRLDYVNGHSVAAYVYRYRDHTVNLFTWPAGQADEAPESQSLGGFHVLHWVRAGTNWWEVSDTGVELRVFD